MIAWKNISWISKLFKRTVESCYCMIIWKLHKNYHFYYVSRIGLKLLTVDYTTPILFTIYGEIGEEQLVLSLGRNVSLLYNTNREDKNVIFFDVDISDGEWHRLGISIKGDSVTIILDCDRHITRKLERNREKTITGIFMIGQQLNGGLYLVRKKICNDNNIKYCWYYDRESVFYKIFLFEMKKKL